MSTNVRTLRIFMSNWRKYPWLTAGSFLLGPAFTLQAIVAPLFIARILAQLAVHHAVSPAYIWLTAASLFGGAFLWYFADLNCSAPLSLNIIRDIHTVNMDTLLRQEYGFFTDNFGGSLVTQANRFAKAAELFHNTFFLEVIGQFCAVIVALGVMLYFNLTIGLIVTFCWMVSIIIVGYLGIRRMPVRRYAVAAETEQTGELADAVTNAVTVKTFASESFEAKRYHHINLERVERFRASWRVGIRNNSSIQIMCGVLQLVVLIGGIRAVQNGSISIAIFLLFEVYILRIIDSIGKSSLFVRQFEGLLGDASEMTELLRRTPLIQDPAEPVPLRVRRGDVEFQGVGFDYAQQPDDALFKSLDISIKAGEKVGLVGPSGGGKTTITKLLLRFMDIQTGRILIDGQAIDCVRQEELRQVIAYVPQEPLMFHRSIMENIRYGRPTADDKAVIAAAKKAHAHEFIQGLSNGYDTLVGERGIKLSGGQRQRVAIARAILKDAPILILDEATSSLDSESEALIQAALRELMAHKTSIVIAHRLSTIQRMDRIIVLNQGEVVEEGTHKALLAKKGLYAKLWSHQSGGFLEE